MGVINFPTKGAGVVSLRGGPGADRELGSQSAPLSGDCVVHDEDVV